jgi:hypothetical protein
VIFSRERGTPLPRRLRLALPALPDGRPVPGLVDFLLTWEELTQRFAATRALRDTLAKARAGLPADEAIAALETTFGPQAAKSAMDEFDTEEGRVFGLRFFAAWHVPGDAPWFATPGERLDWQRRALQAIEAAPAPALSPYPQAPSPYPVALEAAGAILFESAIRLLAAETEKVRSASPELSRIPVSLLIEPFGSPQSGVAGTLRVSSIPGRDVARPMAGIAFRIPVLREWAHWEDAAAKYAQIAREHFATDSVVAPLVQEEELLFREQGARRLHITLGPPASATAPAPDGLAFDFARAGDEEAHRFADRELAQVTMGLDALGQALAASLGIGSARLETRASFALLKGVWRPVVTATLHRARGITGEPLPAPLEAASIEAFQRSWALQAARSWVEVAEAGGRT